MYWYDGKAGINRKPLENEASLASRSSDTGLELYRYDAFNRLSKYYSGSTEASYTYSADNLRHDKVVNNNRTEYVWNGQNLASETSGGNINTYTYDATGVYIANQNGTVSSYLKDNHGNVIGKTDATGTMMQAASELKGYDAYGNLRTGTTPDPFGYCGEYYDYETGLIYLRNRYYDSTKGIFITEDPAKDGFNWYSYCAGDPVMYVDPTGWVSIIFVADGMYDQAEVRREIYKKNYGTTCYVVPVSTGKQFADQWNLWFSDYLVGEQIDAIEIISHGGATGPTGKKWDGTAFATGFLYFGDDPNNYRLMARDTDQMNRTDAAITWLNPINSKVNEFNINGCNSANPDVYNVVYGFMQKVDSYNYVGWDGGAQWSWDERDHIRGGGEYGTTWRHPFDPTYYVREFQNT